MNIKFIMRQFIKTAVNCFFLPAVYKIYSRKPIEKGKVLFADGHHHTIPYSMAYIYECVQKLPVKTELHLADFGKDGYVSGLKAMLRFMKSYATAETVFLCDYYVPAGSCKKREETQVVQLWHACGALKKFGYDASEDMSVFYKGNSMKNCTLVTVSSDVCEQYYARAFGIPKEVVKAIGVSRTDRYFDEQYRSDCRKRFFELCPQARHKKVVLWAPTFRGNARMPRLEGYDIISDVEKELGDTYFFVKKLHPHLEGVYGLSSVSMLTEEVMAAADVLITDYSSVLFDFMAYKKPVILFAPDGESYENDRGFYLDYKMIPGFHVKTRHALYEAVVKSCDGQLPVPSEVYEDFYNKYMAQCDGHATRRIIQEVMKNGRD